MANPHQGFPANPASQGNAVGSQGNFYPHMQSNPAMLAALQQQQRFNQLKLQQQHQHQHQHQQQQHQQQQHQHHQQQQGLSQQQQHGMPSGAFNPALNPQHSLLNPNPAMAHQLSLQERQIAQAKVMAQHHAQQQAHTPSQFVEQQQGPQSQQFGYDSRMMPPPPPPANQQQRPPSTRPTTAGSMPSGIQRSSSQSQSPFQQQQQQQHQQQSSFQQQQPQRFPSAMQPYDAGVPSSLPQHSSVFPQQQQQQQQQFLPGAGASPATGMNTSGMSPAQIQQLQHLHSQGQQQPLQDPRMALHAQAHAQAQHPTSPSPRKRKLPQAASSPGASSSSSAAVPVAAQNINPSVQRMAMAASDARQPAAANPQAATLSLNHATTRVTNIPLAGSGATIPQLTQQQMMDMQKWMDKDKSYEAVWVASRERAAKEVTDAMKTKLGWWEETKGRKPPGERFGLLWPERKRSDRMKKLKRAGISWETIKLPKLRKDHAERKEDLVPLRLEIDVDHHKLRETFIWNVNDPLVTPEIFAQSIVDDFKLASHYVTVIVKSIQEQLLEHEVHGQVSTNATDDERDHGTFDEGTEQWWNSWRKRIRTEDGYVLVGIEEPADDADDEDLSVKGKNRPHKKKRRRVFGVMVPDVMGEVPMDIDELRAIQAPPSEEELRILIKLDILVGTMKLDDQFEWDLACTTNSPEEFAACYTADLGLPGEFTTAVAHQIREQVYAYRKSISGQPLDDDDLRPTFLPAVTRSTVARSVDAASAHMPLLNYMSDGEIERNERERDKELKRKRRTARGRAQATRILPDRTHRTPGVGFPETDNAAILAAQAANIPTTSRRAAAAAASLTIANMVASENGGSPIQMNLPEPTRPKETPKKPVSRVPQRLFKAPPMPPGAIRPRKSVAPIPSTGLDPSKYKRTPLKEPADLQDDETLTSTSQLPPTKLTAKQIRDLEKEAKEKEYAEGQHENIIDGVWHCSNCGCPESIAVGRRKGPLGDKSQCGPCGKFYHRHRRPRPVEYHPEESYHANVKAEAERVKAVHRRKGGAAALRAMNQEATSAPESSTSILNLKAPLALDQDDSEDDHKSESKTGPLNASDSMDRPPDSTAGPASPADSSSSEEPPLSKVASSKANGSIKSKSIPEPPPLPPVPTRTASPTPSPPSPPALPIAPQASPASLHSQSQLPPPPSPQQQQPPQQQQQPQQQQSSPQLPPASVPPAPSASVRPPSSSTKLVTKNQVARPEWLKNALDEMQSRYPEDKFDVVLRKATDPNAPAEWRVKCLDCPGKLYTPGPEETLANFDVHLRNRNHRAKVNARVHGITPPP